MQTRRSVKEVTTGLDKKTVMTKGGHNQTNIQAEKQTMKHIIASFFVVACILASSTAFADNIRPDGFGGWRHSDGRTTRPDGFGGYRHSDGTTTRPDGFGGWRHSDGTTTRPDGFGGWRHSDGTTTRPDGFGGYRRSDGTTIRPDGFGGWNVN